MVCCGTGFADVGGKIVGAARKQIGVTVRYDPAYVSLEYPEGDVPRESGVCTDVVIRALRDGLAQDLQKLVHEDMRANFAVYPKIWGLKRPDKNIDHRRVPNLMKFFQRKHTALPVPTADERRRFLPGDLVTCTVPPHLPHIMIISDRKSAEGLPLVIHNIGGGAREENRLGDFPLTGHFRWKE
jgi:uncharacterized protein YijF (DUF1287 family)